VIIILIISGFDFDLQIRPLLQIRHLLQIRPVWQWCIDNRFYSCILIFLICNAIEGQLISSGAFEIHFNGKHDPCFILSAETGESSVQSLSVFQMFLSGQSWKLAGYRSRLNCST